MAGRSEMIDPLCAAVRERLSELADNELAEDAAAPLVEHLKGCASCAEEYERFRQLLEACGQLADPEPGENVRLEGLNRLLPRSSSPAPELMNVEELMSYLGVSRQELEMELEDLPAFEFAGQLRFKKTAIDAWIEQRQNARRQAIEASRIAQWRSRKAG